MKTYKKPLILVLAAVVIAGAGWYILTGSDDDAEIQAIVAETERMIKDYSPAQQEALQHELKELDVSSVEEGYSRTEAVGISFSTPWRMGEVTDDRDTAAGLLFPNGQEMVIMSDPDDPELIETPQDYLADLDEDFPSEQMSSLELFTDELGSGFSTYDLAKYIFSITPDDVAAAETPEEARLRAYAIVLRAGNTLSATAQVYHFQTDYVKGFWSSTESMGGSFFQVWTQDKGYSLTSPDSSNPKDAAEIIASTIQPADGDTLDDGETSQTTDSSDDYFTQ